MLEIEGKTLFDYSVESFSNYFSSELFLFIIRDVYGTKKFVEERIAALAIKKLHNSHCQRRNEGAGGDG